MLYPSFSNVYAWLHPSFSANLTHVKRLYLPCGKFNKFRVVKLKNYSNATSIYNLYDTYQIRTYVVLGSLTYTLLLRQFALNHLHPLHFCVMLLTLINALMVALPWSCLPVVTKKTYKKKISSFCAPSNVVTLNWYSVFYKLRKNKAWSTTHTHNTLCTIIKHIWTLYLKLVAN